MRNLMHEGLILLRLIGKLVFLLKTIGSFLELHNMEILIDSVFFKLHSKFSNFYSSRACWMQLLLFY